MRLLVVALDLTLRLRPDGGRTGVVALLSRLSRHHGDGADALPCSGEDAALLLHHIWRLGINDAPDGRTLSGWDSAAGDSAAEPPLARQLTWRVAAEPRDMHPAVLIRAMHASSQLLGFIFVPLMKVWPDRWGRQRCVRARAIVMVPRLMADPEVSMHAVHGS